MPFEDRSLIFKSAHCSLRICNYVSYSVLLVVITIVCMGVVSYLIVPKTLEPVYVAFNFTDEFALVGLPFNSTGDHSSEKAPPIRNHDLCRSKQCDQEAGRLLSVVNVSVDPCEDFYEYVCSVWMTKHQPSDVQGKTSVDYDLLDRYTRFLVSVLSQKNDEVPDAKLLFDSCVNPPENLFHEVSNAFLYMIGFQSWPYSRLDKVTAAELSSIVGTLHRLLELDSLFQFKVLEDPEEGRPSMFIGEPELLVGNSEGSLSEFTFLANAYRALMVHLQEPSDTNIALVEMNLANRKAPKKNLECSQLLRRCTTIHLDRLPPPGLIHWPLLAEYAFGEKLVALNQFIKMPNPEYLTSFTGDAEQQLNRPDLLNYLVFRIHVALSPLLANETLRQRLASIAYGRNPKLLERLLPAHYCVRLLNQFEPYLTMFLAYNRSVSRLTWTTLQDLVLRNLNFTLLSYIQRKFERWFSKEFGGYVLSNVASVSWQPLVPKALLQKSFRYEYLRDLDSANPSSLISSFFFWLRRSARRRRYLPKMSDYEPTTGWRSGFLETWPRLEAPFKILEIPLPVFDFGIPHDPKLWKFHIPRAGVRIYYSFVKYTYYLAYSFYLNTTSSDPASVLENLRGCLQMSYALMSSPLFPRNLDTDKTSLSDMADLLAVKLAFAAYQYELLKDVSSFRFAKAPRISSDQLFFLYYAMNFCENHNPRFIEYVLKYSDTSPGWYRVNGPLRNMREFAAAFQCSRNSFMNPKRKCEPPGSSPR
ncbi:neprilysin-1-like [Ixodes scapularis]